jgi:hypothetical protein
MSVLGGIFYFIFKSVILYCGYAICKRLQLILLQYATISAVLKQKQSAGGFATRGAACFAA